MLGLERLCNTCNCHSTKGSRPSSCFYDIFGFWIHHFQGWFLLGSYDVESVGSQPFLWYLESPFFTQQMQVLWMFITVDHRHWRSGTLSLVGLEAGGKLVKTWVVPRFSIWFSMGFGLVRIDCWVDDCPVTP